MQIFRTRPQTRLYLEKLMDFYIQYLVVTLGSQGLSHFQFIALAVGNRDTIAAFGRRLQQYTAAPGQAQEDDARLLVRGLSHI